MARWAVAGPDGVKLAAKSLAPKAACKHSAQRAISLARQMSRTACIA